MKLVKSERSELDFPVRIQIALYDTLIAECIVPQSMSNNTWAAYACLKYKRGLPSGGANISHVDSPRLWDVPVGSVITKESE